MSMVLIQSVVNGTGSIICFKMVPMVANYAKGKKKAKMSTQMAEKVLNTSVILSLMIPKLTNLYV